MLRAVAQEQEEFAVDDGLTFRIEQSVSIEDCALVSFRDHGDLLQGQRMPDKVRRDEDGHGGFGPSGIVAECFHVEGTCHGQEGEHTCCMIETETAGGPPRGSSQRTEAVFSVGVVGVPVFVPCIIVIIVTVIMHDSVLEIRSRLRWEQRTSAHGAGIVVVKPSSNAIRADDMAAWKVDLALR